MPSLSTSSFVFIATIFAGQSLAIAQSTKPEFEAPVRLQAAGQPIFIDEPGYATPTWMDFTGDGREDLLVGQFDHGKIQIFERKPDGTFMAGRWLEAGGEIAQVPDVW